MWHGEKAKARPISYTVTKVEHTPLHWQNRVIGETRQALELETSAGVIYADNENGLAYYKVTEGEGLKFIGWRQVRNPKDVIYIELDAIVKDFDQVAVREDARAFTEWAQKKPGFDKLDALQISKLMRGL